MPLRTRFVIPDRTGDRVADARARSITHVLAQPPVVTQLDADERGETTVASAGVSWAPPDGQPGVTSTVSSVETTGATATRVALYASPLPNRLVRLTAVVVGRKAAAAGRFSEAFEATFDWPASGSPTQVGVTTNSGGSHNDATAAGWGGVTFVAVGSAVEVRVTGAASSVIRWTCELRAQPAG